MSTSQRGDDPLATSGSGSGAERSRDRLSEARRRLRRRYLEGLRTKIDALRVARDALEGEDQEAAIDCVRRISHQLRGSGASYGLPQITEIAGRVEDVPKEALTKELEELLGVLDDVTAELGEYSSRLLVVEDDEDLATLLRSRLEAPGREVWAVATLEDASRELAQRRYELVLLDLVLPDSDGRALLMEMGERTETSEIPIFVISARRGSLNKTECLALGAEQFFEKPLDLELLVTAVDNRLEQALRFEQQSREDALTGLPNRLAFRQAFGRARALADRQQSPLSLAIVDIDRFKDLNDSYGHACGDEVLRVAARTLAQSLRESDLAARWGGEEFVVLFPDTHRQEAALALTKTLSELRGRRFDAGRGQSAHVTFSAGVVESEDDESLEHALLRADRLLYLAKAHGRDQVLDEAPGVGKEAPRLLYAEDDPGVSSFVAGLFERDGFRVDHYGDGRPALEAARRRVYDVVLLDIAMPEMNGLEVLEGLRADGNYRRVPIILMTAMGKEEDVERAFNLGADDYVQKPFNARKLLARVHRALKRHREL